MCATTFGFFMLLTLSHLHAVDDPAVALARIAPAQVPAIAVAVVTLNDIHVWVAGVRKRGDPTPATAQDQWHLGSNGKAMTAVCLARLVERGLLRWDTPVKTVLPQASSAVANATLEQLLRHQARLPANLDWQFFKPFGNETSQRRAVVAVTPSGDALYSNVGLVIAGAMGEKVSKQPWERLLTAEVFTPLGITSAGFGGTGTPGKLDQPWPHGADGTPMPMNGPAVDNPPVMDPAGRVHMTIGDWGRFVQEMLRGAGGKNAAANQPAVLLQPATYTTLLTVATGTDQAAGWVVMERPWTGGRVWWHNGTNTMNTSVCWLAPGAGFALLACCNQGDDAGDAACDAAVTAALQWQQAKP